jgi:hypothetical protein
VVCVNKIDNASNQEIEIKRIRPNDRNLFLESITKQIKEIRDRKIKLFKTKE